MFPEKPGQKPPPPKPKPPLPPKPKHYPYVPPELEHAVPYELAPGMKPIPHPKALGNFLYDHAAGRLAFIPEEKAWLVFREREGWTPVETIKLECAAMEVGAHIVGYYDREKREHVWTPKTGSRLRFAREAVHALGGLATAPAHVWDSERLIVGIPPSDSEPAGILHLDGSGEIRPVQVTDRVRRSLSVRPKKDGGGDLDMKGGGFLRNVIPDDAERHWVRGRLAVALRAEKGHDDVIWLYGPADSGKTSFLEMVKALFGSYAAGIPGRVLMQGGDRQHDEWKARLQGCRLMVLDDPPDEQLNPGQLNQLVGGHNTAKHMRAASKDFKIDAPLLVTSNNEPNFRYRNDGAFRRLVPVQGGPKAAKKDPALRPSLLRPEWQAWLLAWLLDAMPAGSFTVKRPDSVMDRLNDIGDATPVGEFTKLYEDDGASWIPAHELFRRFQSFMTARGELPGGQRTLTGRLKAHGFRYVRRHNVNGFMVRERSTSPPADGAPFGTARVH